MAEDSGAGWRGWPASSEPGRAEAPGATVAGYSDGDGARSSEAEVPGSLGAEAARSSEATAGSVEVETAEAGDASASAQAAAVPQVAEHGAEPATPVAAALRELDTLGERELSEHPDVYQRIHGELQSALAAIDDA